MTSQEAQDQIAQAIESLKQIRDTLGEQLVSPGIDLTTSDRETRRISELHDRVARAIQAYY